MRKLATAVAVSLALASSGAKALGLGDIEMHSALNQPLDAEILLHSVQPGELEELLVQLASREAFDRAGIERTSALTALKFSIDRKSDGTPFIKIGSNGPVVEPFLNFLLEVDWPKGRMVREYTILLDPPVFMNQDAVSSGGSTIVPETQSQAITEQDLVVPVPIERDDAGIEVVVADGAGAEVDDNTVAASGGDFPGEEVVIDSIAISSDSAEGNAVIGNNPTGTAVANRSPEIGDEGQVFLLDGVRTTSTDIPLAQTFSVDEPAPEAAAPAAVTTSTGTAAGDAMPEVLVMGDTEEVGNDNGVVVSNDVSPAGDESYLVERNDTLWQIAAGAKPANASVQQMMMALLRLNRDAFVDNNVNRLKAGAILRMPSGEEINATSRGEAVAMMTEQNRLWQEYRDSIGRVATAATSAAPATPAPTTPEPVEEEPAEVTKAPDASAPGVSESSDTTTAQQGTAEQTSPELKIVADPTTTDSDATANADETDQPDTELIGKINTDLALAQEEFEAETLRKEELQNQASELESNTEKMERLIELRESEMAQLQDKLAAAETAGGDMAETPEAAVEPEEVEPVATAEPQVVEPPATVIEATTPAEEQSFVQRLMSNPAQAAGIGLGALGLLGGLGWLLTRGRRKEEEEVVFEEDEFLEEDDELAEGDYQDVAEEGETEFVASAMGAVEAEQAELADDIVDLDDTDRDGLDDTGMLASALDDESSKDDTISEADVYLAYGLHGQAEDLLTKAVDRDPENQDYHLKLIETHHGQKNLESFNKAAQNFRSRFGGTANPTWARVAEMGRELDPENQDYAAQDDSPASGGFAAGVAAAAAGGLGAAAAAFTGSDEDEKDSTVSLSEFDGTGDVTEIISPAGGLEQAAEESLMDQSIDPGLAFDEADLEATGDFSKIAAEFSDDESLTLDESVAEAAEEIEKAAEPALELDEDEGLSFTVEDDFVHDMSSEVSLKAEEASGELGSMIDQLKSDGSSSGRARVLPAEREVNLDAMNDTSIDALEEDTGLDFEESVLDLSSLKDEDIQSDGLEELELAGSAEELTLDLDQLGEDELSSGGNDEGIEGLFDHTETLDTAFDQTQELEIPDLTASADLTSSDDSSSFGSTNEMETMLDLAKAYIDMGDNDSARSALGEISRGGNDEQKATAEQLLKKIG